ncbi:transcription termination factor 2 [Plakobranchus ocellatus]|uniref:Transcription termination factor 2 n=1 Tax=Plakobranchus ocellatus TaxID=259542 RepID=A0AAV3Z0B8_9GAST|nr:transcription termination factor 2 [Plakobranchus ocellatus]
MEIFETFKCPNHPDGFCYLKTGLKPGPNQGKSFYVCTRCSFVKPSNVKALACPDHPESTVEIQSVVRDDKKNMLRCYYRCPKRTEGKTWCGYKTEKSKMESAEVDCKTGEGSTPSAQHAWSSELGKHEISSQVTSVLADKKKAVSVDFKSEPSSKDMPVICVSDDEMDTKQDVPSLKERSKQNMAGKNATSSTSDMEVSFASLSKSARSVSSTSDADMDVSFAEKSFQHYRESPAVKSKIEMRRAARKSSLNSDDSSDADELEEKYVTGEKFRNLCISDRGGKSISDIGNDVKQITLKAELKDVPQAAQKVLTVKMESRIERSKIDKPSTEKDKARQEVDVKDEKSKPNLVNETSCEAGDVIQKKVPYRDNVENLITKRRTLYADLMNSKSHMKSMNLSVLPDKGQRLISRIESTQKDINDLDHQIKLLRLQEAECKQASQSKPSEPDAKIFQERIRLNSQLLSKDSNNQPCQPVGPASMVPRAPAPVRPVCTNQPLITQHAIRNQPAQQLWQVHPRIDQSGTNMTAFDLQRMYAANPQALTLYGGRMTAQRLREVGTITTDAVNKLHQQLETRPCETVVAPDPKGLTVELKMHQKQALSWLAWREEQQPSGGILADDMGLGKTLTTIAHVLQQKLKSVKKDTSADQDKWQSREKAIHSLEAAIKKTKATLIIAPASVLHQWAKEIERRVKPGRLKFLVYHGPSREKNIHRLIDNDIVLTTYTIVSKEVGVDKTENAEAPAQDVELDSRSEFLKLEPNKPDLPMLLKIGWERIVLDEAHNIKNHKSLTSMAICRLRAAYRWALTGTPIQNNLLDMYSLLRFLRFSPFDEYRVWTRHVDNGRGETKRLNTIVQALLLRRTKDQTSNQGRPLVELPEKKIEVVEVTLTTEERTVYEKLFRKTQSTVRAYVNRHRGRDDVRVGDSGIQNQTGSGSSYPGDSEPSGVKDGGEVQSASRTAAQKTGSQILVLLLRLRQCCSHLSLMRDHLETESMDSDGIELSLEEQMRGMQLEEMADDGDGSVTSLAQSKLFQKSSSSTKVTATIDTCDGTWMHYLFCLGHQMAVYILSLVRPGLDRYKRRQFAIG